MLNFSTSRRALCAAVLCSAFCGLAYAQAKDSAKDAAKGPPKPPPAMPVKAAIARVGNAIESTVAVGTLRADEAVMLRPEIVGRIAKVHFNEGQRVARGAPLISLDASELTAILAGSTSEVQISQQRLTRAEDLFQKKFISQQALDDARTALDKARAKQAEDKARLARTEIRAPFPGVMGLRQVSEGAFVAIGTDIARLEKIDQLKLDFRIPETYVARVRVGQVVSMVLDAFPGTEFSGSVFAIEPGVDEATRTVLARARVPNPALKLRPGMFARVSVQLGERKNAIWIPEQAIVPRGQESTVYKVVDGKVAVVPVRLGMRQRGEVEILQGVAAGEQVITDGTQKVGPGAAVMVLPDAPAAGAPTSTPTTAAPPAAKPVAPAPANGEKKG